MYIAIAQIKRPSKNPESSSNFPCPKGCWASAGSADFLTDIYAIKEAAISLKEWRASDIILKLPVKKPAISLRVISSAFEHIEINYGDEIPFKFDLLAEYKNNGLF